MVLEAEISREQVPLRNAYRHVGQKASVRVNSGVEYTVPGEDLPGFDCPTWLSREHTVAEDSQTLQYDACEHHVKAYVIPCLAQLAECHCHVPFGT